MAKKAQQPEKIFLIGFSGSGKSTVGPLLGARLDREFIDTDSLIAEQFGKDISDIFAEDGETAFRTIETDIIREIVGLAGIRQVIALGGGAFNSAENRDLVSSAGIAVYLQCSVREIARRMRRHTDRPLLSITPNPRESLPDATHRRITELLESRREFYQMSDMTVSTTARMPNAVVEEIVRKLDNRYESH